MHSTSNHTHGLLIKSTFHTKIELWRTQCKCGHNFHMIMEKNERVLLWMEWPKHVHLFHFLFLFLSTSICAIILAHASYRHSTLVHIITHYSDSFCYKGGVTDESTKFPPNKVDMILTQGILHPRHWGDVNAFLVVGARKIPAVDCDMTYLKAPMLP